MIVSMFVWKQDLQDGLNFGLFCPPDNGRAGKFMDEERLLTDYALPGPIGYLEVTCDVWWFCMVLVDEAGYCMGGYRGVTEVTINPPP